MRLWLTWSQPFVFVSDRTPTSDADRILGYYEGVAGG